MPTAHSSTRTTALSRRHLLATAGAVGTAGLTASAASATDAASATNATTAATAAGPATVTPADPTTKAPPSSMDTSLSHMDSELDGPVVVHVRDLASGVLDVFAGTTHRRLRDPELAALLARAASRTVL